MSRVLIIGAGIVGLSCAYALVKDGHEVTILDRDPAGDKASFGNAGGIGVAEITPASAPGLIWRIPGWLFDPLGPLSLKLSHVPNLIPWLWRFLRSGRREEVERITRALAALLTPTYDDLLPMLKTLGLMGDLHQVGALWVYETEAGFAADADDRARRIRHGVLFDEVSVSEARTLEPALGENIARAMMTSAWSHLSNPKRLVDRLRQHLATIGVSIVTGEAAGIGAQAVTTKDGQFLLFDHLVVAAGAWSARLAKLVGDHALLESERGYNTTLPTPNVQLNREVIFAEHKFVATPMDMGLRIGGAAEFAGLDAPPNYARSLALVELAARYLPGLNAQGGKPWMGHRPTTPDSMPVIGASPRRLNVFYAFGHSHIGLTAGPTSGRLIAELIAGKRPSINLAHFAISRFEGGGAL